MPRRIAATMSAPARSIIPFGIPLIAPSSETLLGAMRASSKSASLPITRKVARSSCAATVSHQLARVLCGVLEHVRRERTHRPIGTLMLLVEFDVEELLEEGAEPE